MNFNAYLKEKETRETLVLKAINVFNSAECTAIQFANTVKSLEVNGVILDLSLIHI